MENSEPGRGMDTKSWGGSRRIGRTWKHPDVSQLHPPSRPEGFLRPAEACTALDCLCPAARGHSLATGTCIHILVRLEVKSLRMSLSQRGMGASEQRMWFPLTLVRNFEIHSSLVLRDPMGRRPRCPQR